MSQEWEVPTLTRRSLTHPHLLEDELLENQFWQQAQGIFQGVLLQESYNESLYVEVMLSEEHSLTEEIPKFLEAKHPCLLLVGQYGVGKSSLLQHFYHQRVLPQSASWAWIYFDGNKYSGRLNTHPELLPDALLEVATESLEKYLATHDVSMDNFLLDVFEQDRSLRAQRLLESALTREGKITAVSTKLKESSQYYLEVTLRYLSRNLPSSRVILVLDNLDPLVNGRVESKAVRQVMSLAVACQARGIVAIRTRTEDQLHYSDPDFFGQFTRSAVSPPPLTEIVRKRVSVAIERPAAQNAKLGTGAIQYRVRECPEFADLLVKGLSSPTLQRVMAGLANDSVREGLRMAVMIYASPYLDPKRIIGKLSPVGSIGADLWQDYIPNYIALRSLALRTRLVYDPAHTWIDNVFGTKHSITHVGPFLRLHILRFLAQAPGRELDPVELASSLSTSLRIGIDLVQAELKWLSERLWIERPPAEAIRITRRGLFIQSELIYNREYLSCISTDVDMPPEREQRLISPTHSFVEQLSNLTELLQYLIFSEDRFLRFLSQAPMAKYCRLAGTGGLSLDILSQVRNYLALVPNVNEAKKTSSELAHLDGSAESNSIRSILKRYCS